MTKRRNWIFKNSRTHQVLTLLSDGKIHKTTELEKPEKTRDWPTSQAEDRHSWFWRTMRKGYIICLKPQTCPSKWQITKKGIKILELVK